MVKRILLPGIIGLLYCFATFASAAKKTYVLENARLSRTLVVENGAAAEEYTQTAQEADRSGQEMPQNGKEG